MFFCNEELRQLRQVAAKVATPKHGSAAGTLTIPRIKEIPLTMVHPSPEWATLALRWLETGWQPKDETKPAQYLVQDAITDWLDRQIGHIKVTELTADITLTVEQAFNGIFSNQTEIELGEQAYLSLSARDCEWHILKPLGEIEERHPGLGQTALSILGCLGPRLLEIITPEYATSMAEYIWWNGESSQEGWLAMMIEYNGMEEDDIDMESSPNAWHESFPDWQINPKKLDNQTIRKLAKRGKTQEDRALAALLLKFDESVMSIGSCDLHEYWEGHNIKPCAIFDVSNEAQTMGRLLDDFDQQNMESGEGYEAIAFHAIPFDFNQFHLWKVNMEKRFYAIRLLDRMISMISIPYSQ